jgi:hypothetical protein
MERADELQPVEANTPALARWLRRLSWVLWPAFLMAGVTEALVFSVLDPSDMHWWGQEPMQWPRAAVYTVSFFIFWMLCALSSALTLLLALSPAPAVGDEVQSS